MVIYFAIADPRWSTWYGLGVNLLVARVDIGKMIITIQKLEWQTSSQWDTSRSLDLVPERFPQKGWPSGARESSFEYYRWATWWKLDLDLIIAGAQVSETFDVRGKRNGDRHQNSLSILFFDAITNDYLENIMHPIPFPMHLLVVGSTTGRKCTFGAITERDMNCNLQKYKPTLILIGGSGLL